MKKLSEILSELKTIKADLADRFHVSEIGIYGSVTRADFGTMSDIDILVDFDKPIGIKFIELADYIEQHLKHKVDLVSKKALKDRFYQKIINEIVYV